MMKKKISKSKLKSYSALAGATLAGVAANGQVAYTDIDDVTLDEVGDFYDLDMNNDGVVDFRFKVTDENIYYNQNGPYSKGQRFRGIKVENPRFNKVLGKSFGKGWGAAYDQEDSVAVYGNGMSSPYSIAIRGVENEFYGYSGNVYEYDTDAMGYFEEGTDKYLGVEFYDDNKDKSFYGWIRVNVSADDENIKYGVTIKDFAYNMFSGQRIRTSIGANMEKLPSPQNVVLADVGNSNTSKDLKLTFGAASDETNIDAYGVYLVKASSPDIKFEDIQYINENPELITADGSSSYEVLVGEGVIDIDGDLVVSGVAYKALVFSIDGDYYYNYSEVYSNEVTIDVPSIVAENVVIADVSDNGDMSDLKVSFDKATDETNIQEYRIIILEGQAGLEYIDSSRVAATSNFSKLTPNDANHSNLTPYSKTLKNNNIEQGKNVNYYAIVVSKLDNGNVVYSTPSNGTTLGVKSSSPVKDLKVNDIADSNNSTDLELIFSVPENPNNFGNYIDFVFVPESAGELTEQEIIAGNDYSYNVTKDSASVDTVSNKWFSDYKRNSIQEGVKYKVYPITRNSGNYNQKTLGTPTEITLTSPLGAVADVNVIASLGTSVVDWKVICNGIEKFTNLEEYRVFVVKDDESLSFDLDAAKAVADGGYLAVKPMKNSFELSLGSDMKDINGDDIESNTGYRVFVLAVGNSKASADVLSAPSNKVALVDVVGIDEGALSDNIFATGKTINIPELTGTVTVFNTMGTVVLSEVVEGSTALDTDLSTGIYIVNIQSEDQTISKKIYIE